MRTELATSSASMTCSADEDSNLLQRIHAGDLAAEERLFRKYQQDVLREALRRGLSLPDAEEVASSVLCTMLEKAQHRKLLATTLRPWLMKVARNRVIDHRRVLGAQQRDQRDIAEALQGAPSLDSQRNEAISPLRLIVLEAEDRIRAREEAAPRTDRSWSDSELLAWIAHRCENSEMAGWMKINKNTLRQRKFRALRMLKKEIEGLEHQKKAGESP